MKKLTALLLILLLLLQAATLSACQTEPVITPSPSPEGSTVAVTGVTLEHETFSMLIGESVTLSATVFPENATNKAVRFSSSNEAIVKVDNSGKVTAVSEGTATLTATTEEGGKTATCEVTVLLHASLHVMKSAHHAITLPMMSYLLYSSLYNFVNTYAATGYLPYVKGEGGDSLNVNMPLTDQYWSKKTDQATGETVTVTWFDYFANDAINVASRMLILCEQARENALELNADETAEITNNLQSLSHYASYYGYASTNAYLADLYGDIVTENDVKEVLTLILLANKQEILKATEIEAAITEQDVNDYYAAHRDSFDVYADYIRYTFEATYTPCYDSEQDLNTYAKYLARIDELEARANALAAAKSAEAFDALLLSYLQTDGMTAAQAVAAVAAAHLVNQHMDDSGDAVNWLFGGKAPEANDTKIFDKWTNIPTDSQSASAVSYTVYFLTAPPHRDEATLKNVGHILFQESTFKNLVDASTLTGATKALAERVLAKQKALSAENMAAELITVMLENGAITEKTDENGTSYYYMEKTAFEAYGKAYTEDGNVFYAHVKRGQMVKEFENWLYAPGRHVGEISPTAVKTTYGYHIMFYNGADGALNWAQNVFEELSRVTYNNWYTNLTSATPLDLYSDLFMLIPSIA